VAAKNFEMGKWVYSSGTMNFCVFNAKKAAKKVKTNTMMAKMNRGARPRQLFILSPSMFQRRFNETSN
jgi:hypothetical protein